ncbi:hypothetical protein FRX31_026625, partial [Thalictrum thalictroides]
MRKCFRILRRKGDGWQVMEVEGGMSKDRANQSAVKASLEETNKKGVGEGVESGEVWSKEQSEVKVWIFPLCRTRKVWEERWKVLTRWISMM